MSEPSPFPDVEVRVGRCDDLDPCERERSLLGVLQPGDGRDSPAEGKP